MTCSDNSVDVSSSDQCKGMDIVVLPGPGSSLGQTENPLPEHRLWTNNGQWKILLPLKSGVNCLNASIISPTLTGIKFIETNPKFSEAWEQFWFYTAVDRIVDPLVCGGQNIAVCFADTDYFSDFPSIWWILLSDYSRPYIEDGTYAA